MTQQRQCNGSKQLKFSNIFNNLFVLVVGIDLKVLALIQVPLLILNTRIGVPCKQQTNIQQPERSKMDKGGCHSFLQYFRFFTVLCAHAAHDPVGPTQQWGANRAVESRICQHIPLVTTGGTGPSRREEKDGLSFLG